MKRLLFWMLCLTLTTNFAQNFEGTIKWSMKMEFTDPAMTGKINEGQQMMNDPAMQAKMKEAQAQMNNNPQLKAMMESNPAMKAQLEKAMGGGALAGSSMGMGITMKVKNGDAATIMNTGMMGNMEFLFLKERGLAYSIDRKNKTYSAMSNAKNSATKPNVKVTKTTEKATIINYNCAKYIVEITDNGQTTRQIFWTTTEIKEFDVKTLSQQRMGRFGGSLYYDGLEGMPLKIEMATAEGKMQMEVVEIKKEMLNPADFSIPADFKETKGYSGY